MTFGTEIPEIARVYKGDTKPLTMYVKDYKGDAIDLTSYSAAAFSMAEDGAAAKTAGGAAVIAIPASGKVTYAWAAGETDTAGNYLAQLKLTDGDSKIQRTQKFTVTILDSVPE